MRKEYGDLIEFVLNNTDCTKFSYLVLIDQCVDIKSLLGQIILVARVMLVAES